MARATATPPPLTPANAPGTAATPPGPAAAAAGAPGAKGASRAWRTYQNADGGAVEGWDLAERYLPLVKSLVSKMRIHFPSEVDQEDIYSVAVTGLVAAIQKFDPTKGRSFGSYATLRIRGALIDELRRLDWMPRSERALVKSWHRKVEELGQVLKRPPTDEEVREEMGMSEREYAQLLEKARPVTLIPLDKSPTGGDAEGASVHEVIPDANQVDGRELCEDHDRIAVVRELVLKLPETQRKVLMLYYYEEMRLAEIAEVFGLSESRICQIHAQAVKQLRAALARVDRPLRGSGS